MHEDDDVVIIDKPHGLITADPSRAQNADPRMAPSARAGQTLFDFVKRHVRLTTKPGSWSNKPKTRERPEGEPVGDEAFDRPGRVWIIHRLDKEASGLVVFAKSRRAYELLKPEFASKKAHRLYYAVTEGKLGEVDFAGQHQSEIEEDRGPDSRKSFGRERDDDRPDRDTISDRRKLAITRFRVVATGNDRSLVQVRLDTGRKNQIRIHMRELGHPLVGDARFGSGSDPLGRVCLHGAELGFTHPANNQSVRYSSPPPGAFYRAVGSKPPKGSEDPAELAAELAAEAAKPATQTDRPDTSWENVAQWYDTMLEDKGNDHYEEVIMPAALRMLEIKPGMKVLDVACGQGILCRRLAALGAVTLGIDASKSLIEKAKERSPELEFRAVNAKQMAELGMPGVEGSGTGEYDAATCIMALANIDQLEPVMASISRALKPGGVFVAVLSHPAFRVPHESDWGWDQAKGKQFRRVESYLSSTRREITMSPGKRASGAPSEKTITFHRPMNSYVRLMADAGMLVDRLDELVSQRAASSGPRAPEENRARLEIPLFLAIRARKV